MKYCLRTIATISNLVFWSRLANKLGPWHKLHYSTITKHSNLNFIDRLQFPWLTARAEIFQKICFFYDSIWKLKDSSLFIWCALVKALYLALQTGLWVVHVPTYKMSVTRRCMDHLLTYLFAIFLTDVCATANVFWKPGSRFFSHNT